MFHQNEIFGRAARFPFSFQSNLSEKGARLCRRPAAANGKRLRASRIRDPLRLVEDDTAALRDFQAGS